MHEFPGLTMKKENRSVTELERGEGRGIEFNPHVFPLPMRSDDCFPDERCLEVRGRNAVNDFGIVSHNGFNNLLADAVLRHRPPRRLDLRKLRHCKFSAPTARGARRVREVDRLCWVLCALFCLLDGGAVM